ncbi:hypothetical protein ODJ79_34460 [Actinoplanes sp. KI2]|uniref:DUF6875 domain-containing protein n=1 Tax=Actinoplanes sp. KI2 TaxID=2983315 RepID=UPI0021D60342|nr:hypothetical protein [Actinoplanes sp. KI2]MCU7728843.1 hypothetical protein [Actinoplanes sp. KI2]
MTAEEAVREVEDWVARYLTRPHPDLGREGVVCPYTVKAKRDDHLRVLPFDAREGDDAFVALARRMRESLLEIAPSLGADRIYLARLMAPHGLPEPELQAMVERVHTRIKPEFVASGFMVGDFWPGHEGVGVHNPDFRPLSSPIPILGIRHIVPPDLIFFVAPENSLAEKIRYLADYRSTFAGRLNAYWSAQLEEMEAAIHREAEAEPVAG